MAIFLFWTEDVFAQNLLKNPGFEAVLGDLPADWEKYPGTATMSAVSAPVKSGGYALSINKTNNTTGTIYAYQDVDIGGSRNYKFSGYVQKNDANFMWVVLRISWRINEKSIKSVDSPRLEENTNEYKFITLDSALAPDEANIARVEAAANIGVANPVTPVFFDDLTFEEVEPTLSPTLSPSPSLSPAPFPTSSLIPSPSPTPSPKPVKVTGATLSGEILGEESSPAGFFPWEATEEAESQEATEASRAKFISKLFLGLGVVFLAASGVYLWYTQLR